MAYMGFIYKGGFATVDWSGNLQVFLKKEEVSTDDLYNQYGQAFKVHQDNADIKS